MKCELKGRNVLIVIGNLENGEKMITEKDSMSWMSPNVQIVTDDDSLGKMFAKAFSGESIFQNHDTTKDGAIMIPFGSNFPEEIRTEQTFQYCSFHSQQGYQKICRKCVSVMAHTFGIYPGGVAA